MLVPTKYFVPYLLWGAISFVVGDNRENDKRHLIAAGTECVTHLRITEFEDDFDAKDWTCEFDHEDAKHFGGNRFVEIAGVSYEEMADMGAVPGGTILKFRPSSSVGGKSDSFLTLDNDSGTLYLSPAGDFAIEHMNPSIDVRHHNYRRATREPRRDLAASTGTLDTLVIRVIDANGLQPPNARQLEKDIFLDDVSLKTQYGRCSHGNIEVRQVNDGRMSTVFNEETISGIIDIGVNMTAAGSDCITMWNGAIDRAEILYDRNFEDDFDLVMVCLPPGTSYKGESRWVAYTRLNSCYTVYNNDWCSSVSVQMHEVGHNLGLLHSGIKGTYQLAEYRDHTGQMGNEVKNDEKCFNAAKSYQLGWYHDQTKDVDPLALPGGSESYLLSGVIDYEGSNGYVAIRLQHEGTQRNGIDYYIGYNRVGDFNSGTVTGRNEVHILEKVNDYYTIDGNGPGKSWLMATIAAGENFGWYIGDTPVNLKVDRIGDYEVSGHILVHLQGIGDRTYQFEEIADQYREIATTGESRRLEGFSITANVDLEYMAHLSCIGDTPWIGAPNFVGTRGKESLMQGFAIRIKGTVARKNWSVVYFALIESFGFTPLYRDGGFCGNRGVEWPVQAVFVTIVPKNAFVTLTEGTLTPLPTYRTTSFPTSFPSSAPTLFPTSSPSQGPTSFPSSDPTLFPTSSPSQGPTVSPTSSPTHPAVPVDFPARRRCGPGNAKLRYRVKLQTDGHGDETGIATYSFHEDDAALDETVFQRTALKSSTMHFFPSKDKYYCLERNRCYYLEVTDSNDNGMEPTERDPPVYEAYVGKKRVANGAPDFGKAAGTIFCTGEKCMDKKGFRVNGKSCRKYVKGRRPNARKRKCNRIYEDGNPIHVHCPATCGQRAGVGVCSWWKDVVEKLKRQSAGRRKGEKRNPART